MNLAAISPTNVAVARRPAQAGELEVWLSARPSPMVALAGGPRSSYYQQAWLSGTGSLLAVVLLEEADSGTVTLSGVGLSGSLQAGSASFTLPAWLGWSGPLRPGRAFLVSAPEKFRSVTFVGSSKRVAVMAVPDESDLQHGGCAGQRDFSLGSEVRLAPTGSSGEVMRWVPSGELTVSIRPGETTSRLASAAGRRSTAVIRTVKEGVESERHLFFDWQPSLRVAGGDGEDDVTGTLGGPVTLAATLVAPDP